MANKRQCYMLKLKNRNCQNKKRLSRSFYFLEDNTSKPIRLYSFLIFYTTETIFIIKLNTLVTKYTDTLTFNFFAINCKWSIMHFNENVSRNHFRFTSCYFHDLY